MHDVAAGAPIRAARIAVTAIFMILGFMIAAWAPHIPSIKDRLQVGDALLGWVLLCMAAGALAAMLVVGRLVERFGSRNVSVASTLAICVLVNGPIHADSVVLLALALFVMGAASGAMDVAINAHGAQVERRLGRPCMSSLHGGFSIGALAGAGLGTLMLGAGFAPWQHTLALSLSGTAVALICIPFLLPSAVDRIGRASAGQPRRRLRISPVLLVLGGLGMIAMMAEGAMVDWSAVYMRDVADAALAEEPWAFGGFSAAMAVMRLSGDRLNHWMGAQTLFRASALVAVSGCALMALWPGVVTGVIGATLVGVGVANGVPLVCAAVSQPGAHNNGQGAGSGMATVIGLAYCGFLLGPPVVGGLSELFSLQISIGLIGVLLLVLVAVPLPGGRDRR